MKMTKRIGAVVLAALTASLLFVSCGKKTYNGFEVKKGLGKAEVIMLPASTSPDEKDFFEFPLATYKVMEETLLTGANLYNGFVGAPDAVTDALSEKLDNIYTGSVSEYVVDQKEKAGVENWLKAFIDKEDADLAYTIDGFLYGIASGFDDIEYSLEAVYEFLTEGSWWYESVAEVINDYRDDSQKKAEVFISFYFPTVKFNEYTAGAVAADVDLSALGDAYADALKTATDAYGAAMDVASGAYSDALNAASSALNAASSLSSGAYSDALDAYSSALNAASSLYSDSYSDALDAYSSALNAASSLYSDSYADAYSDALDALDAYSSALDALGGWSW